MPKRYFLNPYTATQNIKQDASFWKSKITQIVDEIVQHQKLGRRDLGWWRNKSSLELNIIKSISRQMEGSMSVLPGLDICSGIFRTKSQVRSNLEFWEIIRPRIDIFWNHISVQETDKFGRYHIRKCVFGSFFYPYSYFLSL